MKVNQQIGSQPGSFRISIAGTDLKFRDVEIADPVPTGRQIIEAGGYGPPDEYVVLQWFPDKDLDEIELDKTTDLREPGADRFIVAKSSEWFEFVIDERRHPWPEKLITRDVLILLAGLEPSKFSVWQELRHSPTDKEITDGHPADLAEPGLERFYTVQKHTTEGKQ